MEQHKQWKRASLAQKKEEESWKVQGDHIDVKISKKNNAKIELYCNGESQDILWSSIL